MEPTEQPQESSNEEVETDILEVLCDASEFPESEEKLIPHEPSKQSPVSDPRTLRRPGSHCSSICLAVWQSPPVRPSSGNTLSLSPISSRSRDPEEQNTSDHISISRETNRQLTKHEPISYSPQLERGNCRKRASSFDEPRRCRLRRSFSPEIRVPRPHEPYLCRTSPRQLRDSLSPHISYGDRQPEKPETNPPDREAHRSYFEEVPSLTSDLFIRLKNVIEHIDPEEELNAYLEPWKAAGGDVFAIAEIAANRLIQFGSTLLCSERFLQNVHYLLSIVGENNGQFSTNDRCEYSRISMLKRRVWHHLREALPDLPAQKLIYAIAWRQVYGDYYIQSLLKAAFLPKIRKLREQLMVEGPTGEKKAERLMFLVIGSLPSTFLPEIALEVFKDIEPGRTLHTRD